jgi:16S rRNA C1402 (ribose-2'-O) methylase RsmI
MFHFADYLPQNPNRFFKQISTILKESVTIIFFELVNIIFVS